MGTVQAHSAAGFSFGHTQSSGETSLDSPALVGVPRGTPEHQKALIDASLPVAESIRKSLASGKKEYWYCGECNQNPPLEFPKIWNQSGNEAGQSQNAGAKLTLTQKIAQHSCNENPKFKKILTDDFYYWSFISQASHFRRLFKELAFAIDARGRNKIKNEIDSIFGGPDDVDYIILPILATTFCLTDQDSNVRNQAAAVINRFAPDRDRARDTRLMIRILIRSMIIKHIMERGHNFAKMAEELLGYTSSQTLVKAEIEDTLANDSVDDDAATRLKWVLTRV
jgi:hypothetical protein